MTNPVSSGVILHKQTYPQINKIILFKYESIYFYMLIIYTLFLSLISLIY